MHAEDKKVRMGLRKRGPGTESNPSWIPLEVWAIDTEMIRKIYCLPDFARPHCFPDTSPKSSVCVLLCLAMTMKPTGKELHRFLLPRFLTAVHRTAPWLLSRCSQRSTFQQTRPFLCLVLGTKELITPGSLIMSIMQEFSSRRLGDKVHFSMAPFHWLILSFYSRRPLLYPPHTSQKLQHGNHGCCRKECSLLVGCLVHLHSHQGPGAGQPSNTSQGLAVPRQYLLPLLQYKYKIISINLQGTVIILEERIYREVVV